MCWCEDIFTWSVAVSDVADAKFVVYVANSTMLRRICYRPLPFDMRLAVWIWLIKVIHLLYLGSWLVTLWRGSVHAWYRGIVLDAVGTITGFDRIRLVFHNWFDINPSLNSSEFAPGWLISHSFTLAEESMLVSFPLWHILEKNSQPTYLGRKSDRWSSCLPGLELRALRASASSERSTGSKTATFSLILGFRPNWAELPSVRPYVH